MATPPRSFGLTTALAAVVLLSAGSALLLTRQSKKTLEKDPNGESLPPSHGSAKPPPPPANRPPLPTALPAGEGVPAVRPMPLPMVVDDELPPPYPDVPDGGCPNGSTIRDLDGGSGCGYDRPDGGMLRNGPWAETHVSGAVNAGQYVDGRRVGPWRVHDANGHLIGEMSYDDAGQPHGRSRMYDATGEVTRDRYFEHGALHGTSITRLPDGSTLRIVYDHGHQMSEETLPPTPRSP